MEEYKKYLKSKKVAELKNIARSYIKHVKFAFTGVKKGELINHLLKHTMLEDGEIKVIDKDVAVDILIKDTPKATIEKMLSMDNLTKEQIKKLKTLLTTKGYVGRIDGLEEQRDELIKIDADNLRKKHTDEINQLNDEIMQVKKKKKIVLSLLKMLKDKTGEGLPQAK